MKINMKTGVELIAIERERQQLSEGWDAKHDDRQPRGSLALAAACYACNAATMAGQGVHIKDLTVRYEELSSPGFRWPWAEKWWKPSSQLRDLIKAGALVAAEIDRLQREQEKNLSRG